MGRVSPGGGRPLLLKPKKNAANFHTDQLFVGPAHQLLIGCTVCQALKTGPAPHPHWVLNNTNNPSGSPQLIIRPHP